MPDIHEIRKDSILRHLALADFDRLSQKSVVKRFPKGAQIVKVLDRDTNFYIINSGKVRVTLYSSDGKEVSFVKAGGNFGEIAAIDSKPRSANVIALSDAELTIVPSCEFIKLIRNNPDASLEMLQQLTGVIRRLCDRIFEFATLDVGNRICAELLRLASCCTDLDGIARIENPPTQSEMASRISCTREAISREMKKLERAGVIQRQPKKLVVENMQRLREIVNDVTSR
jgi:CRP-like cAMP-binding protein